MSDVDPFKHPPVYKADQVLTQHDLQYLIKQYKKGEQVYLALGKLAEATECCAGHSVAESQLVWLKKGKPAGRI